MPRERESQRKMKKSRKAMVVRVMPLKLQVSVNNVE